MADIMTTLAMLGQATKIAKDMNDISKEFDAAQYKIQIADLAGTLAEAKLSMLDVQEQLAAKDAEIARLQEAMRHRAELVEHSGYFYDKQDDGSPVGRPYCPRCNEVDGLLMKLVRDRSAPGLPMCCPQCDKYFGQVSTFKPKAPDPSS